MPTETTPIEQFFADKASASPNTIAEALRFRTAPTGSYTLQVAKAEGKIWQNETNTRNGAHLTVSILKGGKKVGTSFADVSWQEVRNAEGNLDNKYKLWSQYLKALFPDLKAEQLAELNNGEVIKAMQAFPVSGYVQLQYVVPATPEDKARGYFLDTKRQSAKTEEQEKEYREAGYKQVNSILNVYPHKPELNG